MIVKHSAATVEHFTPAWLVDLARELMGCIDLDPASCAEGNRVVQASRYIDRDGLQQTWSGRVFLNPPGGRAAIKGMGTNSNAALWWHYLAGQWESGDVTQAFFVGFTLEILRTTQAIEGLHPLDFPCCFPKSRIAFDCPDGNGGRKPSSQPVHANVLVWLPPYPHTAAHRTEFRRLFSPIGKCI